MKTTRLNLLLRKESSRKIEIFFKRIRQLTFLYTVFVVTGAIGFFLYNAKLSLDGNLLDLQKQNYLKELQGSTAEEANFNYISKKLGLVNKYISQDPHLVNYYTVLAGSVKSGTEAAQLSSFAINSERRVSFRVSFKTQADMINFLRTIESQQFLKSFDSLVLLKVANLTEGGAIVKQDLFAYELSFDGVFKKL